MPTRGPTHIIDTMAVRFILTSLDSNWMVRNLDERDYGIDLTLEEFDDCNPTGHLVLLQVKGMKKVFPPDSSGFFKFSFPVDTMEYAEKFRNPFFAIIVSLDGKTIHFISLKEYIKKLDVDSKYKGWRSQKTVTLEIPPENDFIGNFGKFKDLVEFEHKKDQLFDMISSYYMLRFYLDTWGGFTSGNAILDEVEFFLNKVDRLEWAEVARMLAGTEMASKFNPSSVRTLISKIRTNPNQQLSASDIGNIKSQIGQVDPEVIKSSLLNLSPGPYANPY